VLHMEGKMWARERAERGGDSDCSFKNGRHGSARGGGSGTAWRHTVGGEGGLGPDRQAVAAGSDSAATLVGGCLNRGGEGL
jgi:hypothetical protein